MQTHSGMIAAPHTPMLADGSLNLRMVERQAELLIESGAIGAFVGGTTGEAASLAVDERLALANRWVETARGQLKIFVHVGHNCLSDARIMARHAAQIGADGISALAPSYFKPANVEDLVRVMAEIAAEAPALPFYYYDIPSMTGVDLPMADFLAQGAERIPNLRGMKCSNPDLVALLECLRLDGGRFEVFFGCDEMLLSALVLGVKGAVGSTYNFATPLYLRMIRAFEAGDLETARAEQAKSVALVRCLQNFGFLAAAKALMALQGVDCGPTRMPVRPLSAGEQAALRNAVARLGSNVLARPLGQTPA